MESLSGESETDPWRSGTKPCHLQQRTIHHPKNSSYHASWPWWRQKYLITGQQVAMRAELPIVIWILSAPLSHEVSNPSENRSDICRIMFRHIWSTEVTEQNRWLMFHIIEHVSSTIHSYGSTRGSSWPGDGGRKSPSLVHRCWYKQQMDTAALWPHPSK